MNKELTPLEALYDLFKNPFYIELGRVPGKTRFNRDIKIIKKALEAFEIIKEKKIDFINFDLWTYEEYLQCQHDSILRPVSEKDLTKEEFELLKEVLK